METVKSKQLRTNFTFSQSSLQDYDDCPRRFQLRYIDQLSWPAVETEPVIENEIHQKEGLLFHKLAQQYLIGLPEKKLTKLANSPNLARWWDNFLNSEYIKNFKAGSQLYPEISLTTPIGPYHLVAKYDLIAIQPDKLVIVDWKTYRKRPKEEWISQRWQTRVYQAVLAKAGKHINNGNAVDPEQIEMVYWFTNYPDEPATITFSEALNSRAWDLIEKTVDEISELQSFIQTSDEKKCRFCSFRSYCDRGTRAGDWQQAETELESEEEKFDINFEQIGEIEF